MCSAVFWKDDYQQSGFGTPTKGQIPGAAPQRTTDEASSGPSGSAACTAYIRVDIYIRSKGNPATCPEENSKQREEGVRKSFHTCGEVRVRTDQELR